MLSSRDRQPVTLTADGKAFNFGSKELGPAGAMELLEEVVPVLEARQAADPSLPRAHLAQLVTGRLPDGRNCGGRATTYVGTLTPPKELSPINAVCQPKRRSVVSITSSWAGLPGLHDAPIVEARDASSDVQLFSAATWWDPLAVLHELGHNLGSGHSHDCTFYDPPLDQCGADEAAGCGRSADADHASPFGKRVSSRGGSRAHSPAPFFAEGSFETGANRLESRVDLLARRVEDLAARAARLEDRDLGSGTTTAMVLLAAAAGAALAGSVAAAFAHGRGSR